MIELTRAGMKLLNKLWFYLRYGKPVMKTSFYVLGVPWDVIYVARGKVVGYFGWNGFNKSLPYHGQF